VTFPAGSCGVLQFDNSGGTNFITGVTDSAGNTWNVVNHASRNSQNWVSHAWWPFPSGATCTITVTYASSNETFAWLGYITGQDATTPKDADGNAQAFATSVTVSTSTTLAADDEIAFVIFGDSNTAPSAWPPTGYTSLFQTADGARGLGANFAYRILSGGSGTTESASISWSASKNIAAGIITFRPAATGGGGGTTQQTLGLLGVGS
jgi:hypothetical protein